MLRQKTVEYAFDTRLTNLATDTTLDASTRHDFSAITIELPETVSRSFRSVIVDITWRDSSLFGVTFNSWRVGIKLGAAAFNDVDYDFTAQANTADHASSQISRDVTGYFAANFGSGATQTCQVGFAVRSASATNINNITCKLIITYDYDDSASAQVKTVRIPIQSHHAVITNVQQEIGTTGGTNNAPANQIPALDTFLPEASKTYKRAWIEVYGNDGSTATTDFNAFIQIDSATEETRATLEQAQSTACFYRDIFIYDTGTYTTNSAHAFKLRSSTTSRFPCVGAVMVVTYTYSPSSTTSVLNSILVSPRNHGTRWIAATTKADADIYTFNLWVSEPGTITLQQSGVFLITHVPNNGTLVLAADGQAIRSYAFGSLSVAGGFGMVHRTDHGNGWVLSSGWNQLKLKAYSTGSQTVTMGTIYAIINYTSGKASGGVDAHNHSVCYNLCDYPTSGALPTFREVTATGIQIPETEYAVSTVFVDSYPRYAATANFIQLSAEILSNEGFGDGWVYSDPKIPSSDVDLSTHHVSFDFTQYYNRNTNMAGGLALTGARKYRYDMVTAAAICSRIWATYHSIKTVVSGVVSGYQGSGAGIPVEVYSTMSGTREGFTTTSGAGNYHINVFNDDVNHFVTARENSNRTGRSDDGNPI